MSRRDPSKPAGPRSPAAQAEHDRVLDAWRRYALLALEVDGLADELAATKHLRRSKTSHAVNGLRSRARTMLRGLPGDVIADLGIADAIARLDEEG